MLIVPSKKGPISNLFNGKLKIFLIAYVAKIQCYDCLGFHNMVQLQLYKNPFMAFKPG